MKRKPFRRRLRLEALEPRRVMSMFAPRFAPYSTEDGFAVRQNEPDMVTLDVRSNDFYDFGYSIALMDDGRDFQRPERGAIEIVQHPQHGRAELSDDGFAILYQPDAGFSGGDKLTYRYRSSPSDGILDPEQTVNILVTDPWLAVPDWYEAQPATEIHLGVLNNDIANAGFSNSYKWSLKLSSASTDHGGQVSISTDGRELLYRSAVDFLGVENLQYTAVDQDGYTVSGEAKIRITASDSADIVWPEELDQQLVARAVENNRYSFGTLVNRNFYYDYFGGPLVLTAMSAMDANHLGSTAVQSLSGFDDTNNQIDGIDESDQVKTDGEYLYVLSAPDENQLFRWGGLRLIDPWFGLPFSDDTHPDPSMLTVIDVRRPDQPTIVSRQIVEDRVRAQDLFEDRLTVIADRSGKTVVSVYDVLNPESMRMVSTTLFSGRFESARRVGDRLLITTAEQNLMAPPLERSATKVELPAGEGADVSKFVESQFWETGRQYLSRVTGTLAEAMLPSQQVLDADGHSVHSKLFSDFNDPRLDLVVGNGQYFYGTRKSILTIDTTSNDGGAVDWDLAQSGSTILVTQDAVYSVSHIADGKWLNDQSHIEKFNLDDVGMSLGAAGNVPGYLLNSFSMDGFDGTFRIATNSVRTGNSIFTLAPVGDELVTIGSLENLAPGERIFATRFAGERAFVVTFRQVDPLLVVDLSDPKKPTLQGELKVPGYSQYLQAIDANHLLSVGRDADPISGQYDGLTVSLFDVSDPMRPMLQDRYEFDGGRTTFSPFATDDPFSLRDHHAIRYFASTGVLALPVYSEAFWHGGGTVPLFDNPRVSAMQTFRIDVEKGIEPLDRILFDSRADRAVRISDYLFSLSSSELKVTRIQEANSLVAELTFEDRGTDDFAETRAGKPVVIEVLKNDGAMKTTGEGGVKVFDVRVEQGNGTAEIIDDGARIRYTPAVDGMGAHRIRYAVDDGSGKRREAQVHVEGRWNWHNLHQSNDVDDDGKVTPRDALLGINQLNQFGSTRVEVLDAQYSDNTETMSRFHFDVDDDGVHLPLDVLLVINQLNIAARQAVQPVEVYMDQVQLASGSTLSFGALVGKEAKVLRLTVRNISSEPFHDWIRTEKATAFTAAVIGSLQPGQEAELAVTYTPSGQHFSGPDVSGPDDSGQVVSGQVVSGQVVSGLGLDDSDVLWIGSLQVWFSGSGRRN